MTYNGDTAMIHANEFHAMRGHVVINQQVMGSDGNVYRLDSAMSGWHIVDNNGNLVSDYYTNAIDVEAFVVHNL